MPGDGTLRTRSLDLLRGLGGCPAVSFLEGPVSAFVQRSLEGAGVATRPDRYGNLIAHLPAQQRNGEGGPPIAMVAHMDHPGFETVESRGDEAIAQALGGVPQTCFADKVPIQVVLPDGERLSGETAGAHGLKEQRMVSLRLSQPVTLEFPGAAVFDLVDFDFDGELVRMRALDDLAGCVAILAALESLARDERPVDVYGVFTGAEEVGLIGARFLAEEGTLPPDTLVVSLEASRTLPGAATGEGPVIRVGDASLTFDAEAESVLLKAREDLLERQPGFKAQRQLMSGGTCEASAFRYYGYRTTGVAFPLGNYHNATPEGGVAAEYIHIEDFLGGVELIVQAARSVASRHGSRPWRRMRDIPEEYRARLSVV